MTSCARLMRNTIVFSGERACKNADVLLSGRSYPGSFESMPKANACASRACRFSRAYQQHEISSMAAVNVYVPVRFVQHVLNEDEVDQARTLC